MSSGYMLHIQIKLGASQFNHYMQFFLINVHACPITVSPKLSFINK